MRISKAFNLAALLVVTGMACIGVSKASANSEHVTLCKKAELECKNPFPNPTTIIAHATNPKLLSSVGTVECEKSLAELSLLNEAGESTIGHLLALSFEGNCHLGGTSCTITVEELGLILFAKTGALEAAAESTGGTKVRVKCGSFIDCKYASKPSLTAVSLEGGETHLIANKVVLNEAKGFLCPSTSELDATYTGLGTMWIESPAAPAEEEIVLCEQPEKECKKQFENATVIVGHSTNPKLLSSVGTVECEKSLAELSLLNEPGESIIGHLLALSFEGSCHLGETSCTITTESLGLILFAKTGPLEASAKSTGGTQIRVKCGAYIDCKYASEPVLKAVSLESGETQLIASKVVLTGGKGVNCPETSEWDATYTALGSMWIESPLVPVVEKEVVLCEKAELECEKPFPNPTMIVAHATNPTLLSSIGTVECEKSLVELSLLNANSESIIGHLLALSFEGNCHLGGTSCTITTEELGLISFAKTGALEASAKSTGGTKVKVACGSYINCKYAGEPLLKAVSLENGETHLTANEIVLSEGKGFLCPSTAKLDTTYTALGTMWIESPGASVAEEASIVLCKKPESLCEDQFPDPTTIVGHAEGAKLLTNLGAVECPKSLMELTLLNKLSNLLLAHLLALSFEGGCHVGETGCTVTLETLGLISFTKVGVSAVTAQLTGGTEFTVKCGSVINCTYGGEPRLKVTSTEGGVTTIAASGVPLKTIKGSGCPKESSLDASYTVLGTMWIEA